MQVWYLIIFKWFKFLEPGFEKFLINFCLKVPTLADIYDLCIIFGQIMTGFILMKIIDLKSLYQN